LFINCGLDLEALFRLDNSIVATESRFLDELEW